MCVKCHCNTVQQFASGQQFCIYGDKMLLFCGKCRKPRGIILIVLDDAPTSLIGQQARKLFSSACCHAAFKFSEIGTQVKCCCRGCGKPAVTVTRQAA